MRLPLLLLLLLSWGAASPQSQLSTRAAMVQRLHKWRATYAETATQRQSLDFRYQVDAPAYTNKSVGSVLVAEFGQYIPTLAVAYDLCAGGLVTLNGRKVYSSNKVKLSDLLVVNSLTAADGSCGDGGGDSVDDGPAPATGGSGKAQQAADEHRLDILLNHTLYLLDNSTKSSSIVSVLFEDDSIAIVDKPNCLHTRKFAGTMRRGNEFTLYDVLPLILSPPSADNAACYYDCLPSPQPVHRLDKKVSGCIVVAKTNRAMMALHKQFENKTIRKEYRAIVLGRICPSKATGAATLDGETILRVAVDVGGLSAETLVKPTGDHPTNVLKGIAVVSTVTLLPVTGRRHQLREHCAIVLGCPIVGDDLYNSAAAASKRHTGPGLYLYCRSVALRHPVGGAAISFVAEEPARFRKLLARLDDYYQRSLQLPVEAGRK